MVRPLAVKIGDANGPFDQHHEACAAFLRPANRLFRGESARQGVPLLAGPRGRSEVMADSEVAQGLTSRSPTVERGRPGLGRCYMGGGGWRPGRGAFGGRPRLRP